MDSLFVCLMPSMSCLALLVTLGQLSLLACSGRALMYLINPYNRGKVCENGLGKIGYLLYKMSKATVLYPEP